MPYRLLLLLSLISFALLAQEKEYNSANVRINKYIDGTLVTPYSEEKVPLIIFIMDAGAINRDGNDRMSRNDTFKKLAAILATKEIASFRYDKRLFKISQYGIREQDISFDHFVKDAKEIVRYFKTNNNYSKIIVAGHGQGSLVGMLASEEYVDGFISIAGNAQPIDDVIIEQLSRQAPGLDKKAALAFKDLKEKGIAHNYEPALKSIFRSNLQPFMRSWIKHNPSDAIQNLIIPVMIIHGDKDIQVELSEAEKLKNKVPNASYLIVKKMNHILRKIEGGRLENQKSYGESWRDIMPQVIDGIITFAKAKPPQEDNN